MREEYNGKISIYGNKRDIARAITKLDGLPNLNELREPEARLKIQDLIDMENLKADILFDGNTVWSKKRIIRNLKFTMKEGVLGYAGYIPMGSILRMPSMENGKPILSDYFYKFLHLDCGSIAHYNIAGWIAEYPTIDDLKEFFMKNEYGKRVLDDIPHWMTDAKRIVREIEEIFKIGYHWKTNKLWRGKNG